MKLNKEGSTLFGFTIVFLLFSYLIIQYFMISSSLEETQARSNCYLCVKKITDKVNETDEFLEKTAQGAIALDLFTGISIFLAPPLAKLLRKIKKYALFIVDMIYLYAMYKILFNPKCHPFVVFKRPGPYEFKKLFRLKRNALNYPDEEDDWEFFVYEKLLFLNVKKAESGDYKWSVEELDARKALENFKYLFGLRFLSPYS